MKFLVFLATSAIMTVSASAHSGAPHIHVAADDGASQWLVLIAGGAAALAVVAAKLKDRNRQT